jgi:hypothetical protein
MNKNQGMLAGTVLALALLFRPAGANLPTPVPGSGVSQGLPGNVSVAPKKSGQSPEGPWLASCMYWAPVRPPVDVPGKETVGAEKIAEAISNTVAPPKDPGCGSDDAGRWGLPLGKSKLRIEMTTMIVTLPDPVHTHLSMAFDRSIDAVLQAASDNHYVSSYYWMPWKSGSGQSRSPDGLGASESGHDPKREREPGLIILKYVPTANDTKDEFARAGFYRVVYLFVVSETPTEGIDGYQFRKALCYESALARTLKAPSQGNAVNSGGILGPFYSGSAASLRAAVDAAFASKKLDLQKPLRVLGGAATPLSSKQMTEGDSSIEYFSFQSNFSDVESALKELFTASGLNVNRIAELTEDDSALGNSSFVNSGDAITFKYPREISLLRNTQLDSGQVSPDGSNSSIPSPYLHFSVKDSGAQDAVPKYSRENTPLSQESQLMAIARELRRLRIQVAVISASDELDAIFLAQFIRRACPDVRLAFVQGDLLMVRDVDDAPFIGTIAVGPYLPIRIVSSKSSFRAYTDGHAVALYNSASFALWDSARYATEPLSPILEGYLSTRTGDLDITPLQWAAVIGSDGYYPLGLVSPCPKSAAVPLSQKAPQGFLPIVKNGTLRSSDCDERALDQRITQLVRHAEQEKSKGAIQPVRPSLAWDVLAWIVLLACCYHAFVMAAANLRLPFGRDLVIDRNCRPDLRCCYLNVATSALWLMAFTVAWPVLAIQCFEPVPVSIREIVLGVATLASGLVALLIEVRLVCRVARRNNEGKRNLLVIHAIAWLACLSVPICWAVICGSDRHTAQHGVRIYDFVGLSFAFRCLHPITGVSPLSPVLLLLSGWYGWALIQTWRLRVMGEARPVLPYAVSSKEGHYWFVSDEDIRTDGDGPCLRLVDNMNSFHVIGRMHRPFLRGYGLGDTLVLTVYILSMLAFALFSPLISLDDFLWQTWHHISNPFELMVSLLLLPLVHLSLSGWVRLLLVWGSLKSELLDRLEDLPIRSAFSRLRRAGWMAILSRVGIHDQRRDLERSLESMRMILRFRRDLGYVERHQWKDLESERDRIEEAMLNLHSDSKASVESTCTGPIIESTLDIVSEPVAASVPALSPKTAPGALAISKPTIALIEDDLGRFGSKLLEYVLVPYWRDQRVSLVESGDSCDLPIRARRRDSTEDLPRSPLELHAGCSHEEPPVILAAEEFVALRYMALIRTALGNLSYLVSFISLTFALAIMAWNSYPFQPRQFVDWIFTAILFVFSAGVVFVFAQLHRDPILSRVTDTRPNELGWDFFLRIISFGAVPVLTWVAYQFPDFGVSIYRFFQPGNSVFK